MLLATHLLKFHPISIVGVKQKITFLDDKNNFFFFVFASRDMILNAKNY